MPFFDTLATGLTTAVNIAGTGFDAYMDFEASERAKDELELKRKQLEAERAALAARTAAVMRPPESVLAPAPDPSDGPPTWMLVLLGVGAVAIGGGIALYRSARSKRR